jgi:hypothetical protein
VRGLDPQALQARVDAMMPAVVAGLTLPPHELERRIREADATAAKPVRASAPV